MHARVRTHLITIAVATAAVALTATGPALASNLKKAVFADDSDRVDNFHAVSSTATRADRANKLVATNAGGRLPNNIIVQAPDANTLDGIDSTNLLPGGTVPRGTTIRGVYATMGTTNAQQFSIASHDLTFGYQLASAPTVNVLHVGDPATAACPGSSAAPSATPGNLCVYESDSQNKRDASYPSVGVGFSGGTSTAFGAYIYTQGAVTASPQFFWSRGTWAVTAP